MAYIKYLTILVTNYKHEHFQYDTECMKLFLGDG